MVLCKIFIIGQKTHNLLFYFYLSLLKHFTVFLIYHISFLDKKDNIELRCVYFNAKKFKTIKQYNFM